MRIVEVIGRAANGVTRPFKCRAENDVVYYVKGRRGRDYGSLVKEWICGRLGAEFGLPVPEVAILTVPKAIAQAGDELGRDLGSGGVFGSREILLAHEMRYADLPSVAENLADDLLVFDRWIMNLDRTLSPAGGNPNLLVSPAGCFVIDHHNAFDQEADSPDAFAHHVFGGRRRHALAGNAKDRYTAMFVKCLGAWDSIVAEIPERWAFVDEQMTLPTEPRLETIERLLARYEDAEFWSW